MDMRVKRLAGTVLCCLFFLFSNVTAGALIHVGRGVSGLSVLGATYALVTGIQQIREAQRHMQYAQRKMDKAQNADKKLKGKLRAAQSERLRKDAWVKIGVSSLIAALSVVALGGSFYRRSASAEGSGGDSSRRSLRGLKPSGDEIGQCVAAVEQRIRQGEKHPDDEESKSADDRKED